MSHCPEHPHNPRILFPSNWREEREAWVKFLDDFKEHLFPVFQERGCTLNTAMQAYFGNVISTTFFEFAQRMVDDDGEGEEWQSKTES